MPTEIFPRTPRLDGTDLEAKRAEILRYFHATFDRYESLFQLLAGDDAYYRKPISLRHPLIFYLGHTATFFINKSLYSRPGLLKPGGQRFIRRQGRHGRGARQAAPKALISAATAKLTAGRGALASITRIRPGSDRARAR